jgi:ribosome-binding factor A
VPELLFFIDDSLEYIDNIDKSLKGEDNPVRNPELLQRRKKS